MTIEQSPVLKLYVRHYVEAIRNRGLTFRSDDFEVIPLKITRRETGRNSGRYYYTVHFIGLGNMINVLEQSVLGVETSANLIRVNNPKWRPPKEGWVNNTWINNTLVENTFELGVHGRH